MMLTDHEAMEVMAAVRDALAPRVKELEIAAYRRPSYAGVMFWLGGHQIERHITESQIKYELDSGSSITNTAQECLDLLAKTWEATP